MQPLIQRDSFIQESQTIINVVTVWTKCYKSTSERRIAYVPVSYCCITKYPKLGLKTPTMDNFSHVSELAEWFCWSQHGSSMHLSQMMGGQSRTALAGSTCADFSASCVSFSSRIPWTCPPRISKGSRGRGKKQKLTHALFKHLLKSSLSLSYCPKHVTWTSPVSVREETIS